jgi:hypothetical protein
MGAPAGRAQVLEVGAHMAEATAAQLRGPRPRSRPAHPTRTRVSPATACAGAPPPGVPSWPGRPTKCSLCTEWCGMRVSGSTSVMPSRQPASSSTTERGVLDAPPLMLGMRPRPVDDTGLSGGPSGGGGGLACRSGGGAGAPPPLLACGRRGAPAGGALPPLLMAAADGRRGGRRGGAAAAERGASSAAPGAAQRRARRAPPRARRHHPQRPRPPLRRRMGHPGRDRRAWRAPGASQMAGAPQRAARPAPSPPLGARARLQRTWAIANCVTIGLSSWRAARWEGGFASGKRGADLGRERGSIGVLICP